MADSSNKPQFPLVKILDIYLEGHWDKSTKEKFDILTPNEEIHRLCHGFPSILYYSIVAAEMERKNLHREAIKKMRRDLEPEENFIEFLLPKIYPKISHAFRGGCGKEAMANWWYEETGIRFDKNILRKVIEKNCIKSSSKSGHSCFELKQKGS